MKRRIRKCNICGKKIIVFKKNKSGVCFQWWGISWICNECWDKIINSDEVKEVFRKYANYSEDDIYNL